MLSVLFLLFPLGSEWWWQIEPLTDRPSQIRSPWCWAHVLTFIQWPKRRSKHMAYLYLSIYIMMYLAIRIIMNHNSDKPGGFCAQQNPLPAGQLVMSWQDTRLQVSSLRLDWDQLSPGSHVCLVNSGWWWRVDVAVAVRFTSWMTGDVPYDGAILWG